MGFLGYENKCIKIPHAWSEILSIIKQPISQWSAAVQIIIGEASEENTMHGEDLGPLLHVVHNFILTQMQISVSNG